MGQANALNKGWGMARGEILAYLSADDVLLPQATRVSVRFLVAQLHLRSGRYKAGFLQVYKAIIISPRTFFTFKVQRMLANGFFNRLGHKLLWTIKNRLKDSN